MTRLAVLMLAAWFGLLCLLGTSPAAAQEPMGTRSLAMGGTLRAAPSADAAVLLNPAGMSLMRSYAINAMYEYRSSDAGSLVNVSIVDSSTAKVGAGLFYNYLHSAPSRLLALGDGKSFSLAESFNTHEGGLALSYPMGDVFYVGLTGKYIYQSVDQPQDTPEAAKLGGTSGFTMDAGAILRPVSSLNLALTGHNLVGLDKDFYPRLLGLGVSYAFTTLFLAEFDSVLNFSTADTVKPSYRVGAELSLGGYFALRGGYMYDTLRVANYVTGGLAVMSAKVALDFGLRQMLSGGADTTVAFSLRLFVN